MPSSTDPSSYSTTIGQHIRLQRPPPFTSTEPLLPKPNRISKSAMSTFFLLPTSSSSNETTRIKKPHSTSSFLGLGCTASSSKQVSVPAVIRSSADWDSSNVKIKKTKNKNKNKGSSVKILSEVGGSGACDVWSCGPGVGFSTDAVVGGLIESVESENPRRNISMRRKIDSNNQREGSSVLPRRSLNQETNPFLDHRHLRQPYLDGLSEMMQQSGFVMGGTLSTNDQFRGMRLNIDHMTYEQLLELGDRIGYVNTGLQEKQIKSCLQKVNPLGLDTSLADKRCTICQDEYEPMDNVGKLKCGHTFHVDCVKQWLMRKNSCPVCKATAFVKA